MKKVLLIDPRGIGSNGNYTKGLINGLLKNTKVTVATNYYFVDEVNGSSYPIYRIFFKVSEQMKHTKIRKIIRGMEYFVAYKNILSLLKNDKFDVVHINWLLMYDLDFKILEKIHHLGVKIVYTAHNVLPHVNGEANKEKMKKIYGIVDSIIVHGNEIKREFECLFPEFKEKLYVQKHGRNCRASIDFCESEISSNILDKVKSFNNRFIFFGNIFYNKGVDILLDFWLSNDITENALLIVAGKKQEHYKKLDDLEEEVKNKSNILYLDYFIDDNLLNYLISKSLLILLPYRHASMSGVVFTAADFEKPILCTSAGSLDEYLNNGIDSFIASDIEEYKKILNYCVDNKNEIKYNIMGKKLQENIYTKCDWSLIVEEMVRKCY